MRAAILFCSVLMLCVPVFAQRSMNVDLIGSIYENWDQPQDVEVANGYAFLATGTTGFQIVDISDPTAPQQVGSLRFEVAVVDVEVAHGYAFLAVSQQGFVIADVRDPTHPRVVSRDNMFGTVKAVEVDGRYAYVCEGGGFHIFDIIHPRNPTEVSFTDLPITSSAIALRDGYLYAGVTDFGLVIYDVSDPENPALTGEIQIDNYLVYRDVQLNGNYAYLSAYTDGWQIFDISDPTNPIFITALDDFGRLVDLVIVDDYAFTASTDQPVFVYDISDPVNPQFADVIPTPGHSYGITADEDYAYVADIRNGLRVLDISDPLNGFEAGFCSTRTSIEHIALQGDYAYLIHKHNGLAIVDISDPASPAEVGHIELDPYTYNLAVAGSFAYVINAHDELLVIDIQDPTSPTPLTTLHIDGYLGGVVVDGDYAYIVNTSFGLNIVDISQPEEPSVISLVEFQHPGKVAVSGGYAYVSWAGRGGDGFSVFDVHDPFNPLWLESVDLQYASSLAAAGNYVYVCRYFGGLHIFDVSDPNNPVEIATFDTFDKLDGVTLSGNHLFLANWRYGLIVVDVSDPANPEGVGYYDTDWQATDVAVDGTTAWVADSFTLNAFDCSAAINGPLVEVKLIAEPPPIVAQGGAFSFGITLNSNLPNEFPVDVWSFVTKPDGTVSGTIARVNNIPMGPGTLIYVPDVHQAVPVSAPIGQYTYHVRVGNYGSVVDFDAFDFTVIPQVNDASGADGWDVLGFEEGLLAGDGEAGGVVELPTEFTVSEAYPNPFNAMTRFTVTLPEAAELTVAVYNVVGQRVVVLADGYMDAGRHEFSVDASTMSSGVYFLHAEATGHGVQVRKLALIR
jgi:hypothetical protein